MMVWAALSYSFTVKCDDPALLERVADLLAGLDTGDVADPDVVTCDEDVAASECQLRNLVSRVNLSAIDAAKGNLLLHAGAATGVDGRAVVVCGASGSGKSTLTVRLAEAGLRYLTDEVVCLDPATLRLTPYRKPVVIKAGSQPLFTHLHPESPGDASWLLPPRLFDHSPAPIGPIVPALLIFPTFRSGARCDIRPMSEAEAAYQAGAHSSRLRDITAGPLPALARLARRAPAFSIVHGDVDLAANAVARLLAAR